MSNILKISEAASLGMHAMTMLAADSGTSLSVGDIASLLGASEAHLAKVMQRLARAGLVKSTRGPKGGFMLGRAGEGITLLEIYEAIEGPLVATVCLLDTQICGGNCILGGLVEAVNKQVRDYLAQTRLSELNPICRR